MLRGLVGSEMCIRDRYYRAGMRNCGFGKAGGLAGDVLQPLEFPDEIGAGGRRQRIACKERNRTGRQVFDIECIDGTGNGFAMPSG